MSEIWTHLKIQTFICQHLWLCSREYVTNKMLPEMKELAELVQPHVWWSDGDWETNPDYWKSTEFLAWLFNECPDSCKDYVVTNDRWGQGRDIDVHRVVTSPL